MAKEIEIRGKTKLIDFTPSHSVRRVPGIGNVVFIKMGDRNRPVGAHEKFCVRPGFLSTAQVRRLSAQELDAIETFLRKKGKKKNG